MVSKPSQSFELRIRNAEGVPIIQLGGSVTDNALKAIKATLEGLAKAGHYHVVLNFERVQAANWGFLDALAGSVRNIRSHYGTVDLVATQDRIGQLARIESLARLFRFCGSEGQAISRIKGLVRQPDALSHTNAKLLENS